MATCARPGCNNELKTGRVYCSTSCAAQVRELRKKSIDRLSEKLEAGIGQDASKLVVDEVGRYLMEGQVPAALTEGVTYGQWVLNFDGTQDYRPDDRLSYDKIDLMLKNGSVIFAMMMKMAQIMRVFSEGRYKVESPDEELRQVADAALKFILFKTAHDFCWSAFAYGTSFQEEVWERKSKYALGLSKSKAAGTEFMVPKVPNSVHPKTVNHIRRDEKGRFNGFAQQKSVFATDSQFNIVDRDAALVIPLNERFRNLWGESFLTAIYPLWIWYEIVLRTMARYLERQAMPVTVGRAPMRGTVNVNGKTEPVGAMDLILSVATNVAKSNAVAIPSDRDPETKEYLFDLDYLVSAERGGEFIKALEFLGQEMIKAGLSADRSLTQSSGGVGSYNIGEVHAEASATTALMIELQFLFYLNKYFMPGFSLYNRGNNGPPIWIRTQSIDMQERQLLMQLVGVAGNSTGGQEFFDMVDFRTMGDMSNIPILSETDVKKRVEERQQQSLDNQEAQQKMMMKFADVSKPAIPTKKPEQQQNKFEEAVAAFYKLEHIPWILGPSDIETLRLHGLITDEQYQLFNPIHDGLGRFASRSGGGGASGDTKSGLVNSQERKKVINQARGGGGFLATTGKILGLTALGAVGLAVIGSIPVEAQEPPEIDPDLINRIKEAEKSGELDTSSWPKANSPEELQRQVTEMLGASGITDIPADLKIVVDDSRLPAGTGGAYFGDTNTYVIRSSYLAKIGDGDPNAYWATIHEIAHSAQETQAEGNNNGFLINIDDEDGSFRGYFEGQNDLATAITISRAYGQPMTQETASNMSAELARENTGIGFASVVGYPEETRTWAGIATAWEQRTGEDAIDFTVRSHNEGLHTSWQRENVMFELFPERMSEYDNGWPPPSVVAGWLATDYDVDPNQAFSEMLDEALSG